MNQKKYRKNEFEGKLKFLVIENPLKYASAEYWGLKSSSFLPVVYRLILHNQKSPNAQCIAAVGDLSGQNRY